MKIRQMLKIGILSAAMLFTAAVPVTAHAEESDTLKWEDFTDEETTEDSAEDIAYSLLRGSYLNSGQVKIGKLSSYKVHVYGMTLCTRQTANVYLSLALERKVNGSYSTYQLWKFSTTNATSLIKGIDVSVPSGYYYRLRGYHAVVDSGTTETLDTLTSGILVN
jgi:hypothetical protein